MRNQRRISKHSAQCRDELSLSVSGSLAACDRPIRGAFERDRRNRSRGREGTMRRITAWHRTLAVLAIGLLALAAPLVALADGGGPHM